MEISFKEYITEIDRKNLDILKEKYINEGYDIYVVGGAIRDYFLKKEIKDIDLATNAPLEITKNIFKSVIPTGEEFGTLTVVLNEEDYEITRFRKDLETDGRRATVVEFADKIEEDLSRRDFTFNGMAYSLKDEKIIDIYNGENDLKEKKIRFIGNPKRRIEEDHLRSIRYYRFIHRYGLTQDKKEEKIIKKTTNLSKISIERIFQEFNKMFSYKKEKTKKEVIKGLYEIGILKKLYLDEEIRILEEVFKLNSIVPIIIEYDKKQFEFSPWEVYKTNKQETKEILKINKQYKKYKNSKILISALNHISNNFELKSKILKYNKKELTKEEEEELKEGKTYKLAIKSEDIIKEGFSGKDIGETINKLYEYIWKKEENNTENKLKSFIKKLKKKKVEQRR